MRCGGGEGEGSGEWREEINVESVHNKKSPLSDVLLFRVHRLGARGENRSAAIFANLQMYSANALNEVLHL